MVFLHILLIVTIEIQIFIYLLKILISVYNDNQR